MLEEMSIISAVALFVIVPIVIGELLDRLLRVSWHYIKKLV